MANYGTRVLELPLRTQAMRRQVPHRRSSSRLDAREGLGFQPEDPQLRATSTENGRGPANHEPTPVTPGANLAISTTSRPKTARSPRSHTRNGTYPMSEPIGQTPSPSSQPVPPPAAPNPHYRPAEFPQQQQWMPAPPQGYQPQPRNGYGVTALVLAIVGLVFGLVPFTGFLAIMCGGTSVLFGFLGLGRVRRHEANNKGLTITGLILGALALLLGVIGLIIVMNAATKLGNDLSKIGKPSSAPPSISQSAPVRTISSNSPTAAATGEEYGSGLYLVGTDIPAGTYHTNGPTSEDVMKLCIWQRKSNDSGEFSSIKASNMTPGGNTVTAQNGEYLQLTGCKWTRR